MLAAEKKPIRVYLCDGRNDNRGLRNGSYDETRDWFYQNVRLMKALTAKGLRRQLFMGHEQSRPEIRRRDPAGNDALAVARRSGVHRPNDKVERGFRQPAAKTK